MERKMSADWAVFCRINFICENPKIPLNLRSICLQLGLPPVFGVQ